MKKELSFHIIIVLLLIIAVYFLIVNSEKPTNVNSFEACANAGFPVMESYPRQCRDGEGNLFVEDITRKYVGYSKEECSRIQVLCTPDRDYFSDETGCGCQLKEGFEEQRVNCTEESRNVEVCIEIYQPVCGWFDPEKINCVKYPCASTFSNSCFSCQDKNVLYYTEGECPK